MSWFRAESSLRTHPKIEKLSRRLGVCFPHALGLFMGLLAWVCDTAPDGNLTSYDAEDLSIAAKWDGDHALFRQALIDVRLLDEVEGELHIHEWMDRAESFKAATRQANRRQLKRDCTGTVTSDGRTDGPTDGRDGPDDAASADGLCVFVRGSIEPWIPTHADIASWLETYSLVPVEEEIIAMREYTFSTPDKRPSFGTVRKFVTSWLNREQRRRQEIELKAKAEASNAKRRPPHDEAGQGSAAHRKYDVPNTSGAVPPPPDVKAMISQLASGKKLPAGETDG